MTIGEFSFRTREHEISALDGQTVDVLVVGGGITGAGVANILAENGISAVLIEKSDFASGTSSASSKLIHGGLRYLRQGRIREVRNLIRERDYLRKNTGIVNDIEFDILITQDSWNRSVMRTGLFIYNLLGHRVTVPAFHKNSGKYPAAVRGYFTYLDACTDDARLVISNICSAVRHGCRCLNYSEAVRFSRTGDLHETEIADRISGRSITVRSRLIVNCAGPWAGDVMNTLGGRGGVEFRLSKGVHLVMPSSLFCLKNAVAFRSPLDGRQLFIIPRGEVVHLGTTDTFVASPDEVAVSDDEVGYLLESTASIFTGISKNDIITTFAGIRPLTGKSRTPGRASRESSIVASDGVINVLGGKLTDYRVTARSVARIAGRKLGRKMKIGNCPSIDYDRGKPDNPVEYDILRECAITSEDILRRREGWRIYSLDAGKSMEEEVESLLAKIRGEIH
jgi:glycerol-3-phosphate dehydrogenase